MRRRLAALAVGVVVAVATSGCGIGAAPEGTGAASFGRAVSNTSWTCDALDEVLANAGRTFGQDLAHIAEERLHGDLGVAEVDRRSAQALLGQLADQVRETGRVANDPLLVAAVAQTGDNLVRLSADEGVLLGVRSFADVVDVARLVEAALYPISVVCR